MVIKATTVNGQTFHFWSDIQKRGTYAKNIATGEVKALSLGCYIRNDLTVRKAIAMNFNLPTFRK